MTKEYNGTILLFTTGTDFHSFWHSWRPCKQKYSSWMMMAESEMTWFLQKANSLFPSTVCGNLPLSLGRTWLHITEVISAFTAGDWMMPTESFPIYLFLNKIHLARSWAHVSSKHWGRRKVLYEEGVGRNTSFCPFGSGDLLSGWNTHPCRHNSRTLSALHRMSERSIWEDTLILSNHTYMKKLSSFHFSSEISGLKAEWK